MQPTPSSSPFSDCKRECASALTGWNDYPAAVKVLLPEWAVRNQHEIVSLVDGILDIATTDYGSQNSAEDGTTLVIEDQAEP